MTDSNGWPDASKPGYPEKPERDGEHMMEWTDELGRVWHEVWKWRADSKPAVWQRPNFTGGPYCYEPKHLTAPIYAGLRYLGPCHTPAKVTALVELAIWSGRLAERDAAFAAGAEAMREQAVTACRRRLNARTYGSHENACEFCAEAIRALPLPKMETSND
jgi:hypothetical protein